MRERIQNHLKDESSPYLLQHADNPVDWYPWCGEAFARAKREDKPVFLSIGYSTCHWCHVMARESFEDPQIAELLNRNFIAVKVDKEERPDIDSIYMQVCQAFTGSGGWPTTVLLTPEQKPFFAGTYFPPRARHGQIGLEELLGAVSEKWKTGRQELLEAGDAVVAELDRRRDRGNGRAAESGGRKADGCESMAECGGRTSGDETAAEPDSLSDALADRSERLIEEAALLFWQSFDEQCGGFGRAPKFPMPHNLLFLMQYYEKAGDETALSMAEKTLLQMYRGGMFDHIGGGFCRYSTDRFFLVPHFEKMLYDNALLILAYGRAYQLTRKRIYRDVAERTASYILREMTSPEGGFYSAQDADSEGEEGKYYLFEPFELTELLGAEEGEAFNRYYDITKRGNFAGKSIPNLLRSEALEGEKLRTLTGRQDDGQERASKLPRGDEFSEKEKEAAAGDRFAHARGRVYEYRKSRCLLHLDDKILTSWNGLMIAAMAQLYRVTKKKAYLDAAQRAEAFIREKLCEGDALYASYRNGARGQKGFLEDYANYVFALLALYEAALEDVYLERAKRLCDQISDSFYDEAEGGFFLYGKEHERLILRPKQTYDEAVFSGNSAMAYDLVRLYFLTGEERYRRLAERQLAFMSAEAGTYPAGYAMFLTALSDYCDPPDRVVAVLPETGDTALPCELPLSAVLCVRRKPTAEYPLKNGRATYYVCRGRACRPPVNELDAGSMWRERNAGRDERNERSHFRF